MPLPSVFPKTSNVVSTFWRKRRAPKAFYIREMILTHIDEMEDYYLAADVVERLRKGQGRTFTAKEVRQDLGLDD